MNKEKNNVGNVILALALMRYLYNKGTISQHVYKNIKKEYEIKDENVILPHKV